MQIELPELCIVALVGASGSGKSSFAKKHFKRTEILSSDYFRGLISDDETDQSGTAAAFDSIYYIANKRLDAGKLTVIDATNVQKKARKPIIALAKEQNVLAVAIVLDMPTKLCIERNRQRPDRNFGPQVVQRHCTELRQSIKCLQREGFRYVYILNSPEEVDASTIVRTKLWTDKRDENGPFDIIGDVHGCYDELCGLLQKLGYAMNSGTTDGTSSSMEIAVPPQGRRAVFLGDLCDRGPKNVEVLRLVMNMCSAGYALCIPGNHDTKLLRKLKGSNVQLSHGLNITVEAIEKESAEFIEKVKAFLDGLVSHYVLDNRKLVVSHAGLKEKLQGRSSGRVREFCLFGDTTGESDEFGLPVRLDWAAEYRGAALVVYGHTPCMDAQFINNTICIDTGCVFGGKLTALRYPERELVDVPSGKEYYPLGYPLKYQGSESSSEPDIADILGKRSIETRLHKNITITEMGSSAALEIMSRFSADPRWIIYLPPTMSPCATSKKDGYLEYPSNAFDYYEREGIDTVICEEKHMGSRAVIVVCRDEESTRLRFGIDDGSTGIIYTRTGRHFFDTEEDIEGILLDRVRKMLDKSGFWDAFSTDWVCLDTELMPWSAKAKKLLAEQYAPVGRAGRDGIHKSLEALEQAASRMTQLAAARSLTDAGAPSTMSISAVIGEYRNRAEYIELYTKAYRRYCRHIESVDDYRIAPFHILASEGKVWNDENHLVHLETINKYITGFDPTEPLFMNTNSIVVDLNDESSLALGIDWWLKLTESGGEGMVVKPLNFIAHNGRGELIQPAIKCRGREYLRVIYGPEYTDSARLEKLRSRSLGKKRRLALDEFALGMESLEHFVKNESFHRFHEAVFAIMALENEKVDPRL
jgi:protein phosphatase